MAIINNIVQQAEIRPSDVVLEIGPGSGNLTMQLLERASHVIAVEIDARMVSELRKRVPSELRRKLTIIHGDFTKIELPPFDLCVSNCPYNVSSAIVFKLLSLAHSDARIRAFTLMFQLEFAQSLAAEPGQEAYSRLSVNTRLLTKSCKILFKVDPKNFTPPPQVDSAVIQMVPLNDTGLDEQRLIQFEALTRVCFSTKNKMIRAIMGLRGVLNMLEQNYKLVTKKPIDKEGIKVLVRQVLDETKLEESRPFKMTVNDFLRLLKSMGDHNLFLC